MVIIMVVLTDKPILISLPIVDKITVQTDQLTCLFIQNFHDIEKKHTWQTDYIFLVAEFTQRRKRSYRC